MQKNKGQMTSFPHIILSRLQQIKLREKDYFSLSLFNKLPMQGEARAREEKRETENNAPFYHHHSEI